MGLNLSILGPLNNYLIQSKEDVGTKISFLIHK